MSKTKKIKNKPSLLKKTFGFETDRILSNGITLYDRNSQTFCSLVIEKNHNGIFEIKLELAFHANKKGECSSDRYGLICKINTRELAKDIFNIDGFMELLQLTNSGKIILDGRNDFKLWQRQEPNGFLGLDTIPIEEESVMGVPYPEAFEAVSNFLFQTVEGLKSEHIPDFTDLNIFGVDFIPSHMVLRANHETNTSAIIIQHSEMA